MLTSLVQDRDRSDQENAEAIVECILVRGPDGMQLLRLNQTKLIPPGESDERGDCGARLKRTKERRSIPNAAYKTGRDNYDIKYYMRSNEIKQESTKAERY